MTVFTRGVLRYQEFGYYILLLIIIVIHSLLYHNFLKHAEVIDYKVNEVLVIWVLEWHVCVCVADQYRQLFLRSAHSVGTLAVHVSQLSRR